MNTSLYELSQNYHELSQCDDESLKDTFESIQEALEVKVENTCKLIKNIEAEAAYYTAKAEIFQSEADRLKAIGKSRENKAKALKEYILNSFTLAGIDKIATSLGLVKKEKGSYTASVTNESILPKEYFRIVPEKKEPDKDKIKKAIRAGKEVPGAELHQAIKLAIR